MKMEKFFDCRRGQKAAGIFSWLLTFFVLLSFGTLFVSCGVQDDGGSICIQLPSFSVEEDSSRAVSNCSNSLDFSDSSVDATVSDEPSSRGILSDGYKTYSPSDIEYYEVVCYAYSSVFVGFDVFGQNKILLRPKRDLNNLRPGKHIEIDELESGKYVILVVGYKKGSQGMAGFFGPRNGVTVVAAGISSPIEVRESKNAEATVRMSLYPNKE